MDRRAFLAAAAGGAASLAGCGGDSSGVPGETTATTTATTTTTTTTVSSADIEFPEVEVGQYPEWMVRKEGASLFLFTYYPRFAWLVDQMPSAGVKNTIRGDLTGPRGNLRPTGVLDPATVEEYFYGFTDVDGLAYHLVWGRFGAGEVGERLQSDRSYEPVGESVGEFDLLRSGQRVVGVADGRLIAVKVGFAEPVPNFERVHRTVAGDAGSYTATDDTYRLLVEHLQDGHRVESRPNEAESLGVEAYGRQYAYGTDEFSRVREVLVAGDEPTESGIREAVLENSGIATNLDATIESIAVDGRVATVTYAPLSTNQIWGSRYA
ncbi:MAG: hypothetical protein ABEH77_02265 [Halobacteriaceae archaeon]